MNHCRADSSVQKPEVDKVVSGYNAFAFNLFSELTKGGVKENIFISPASVAFDLAMVYNGAAGETKKEMEKVLGLEGIGHPGINLANQSLLGALTNRSVILEIANSLWARKGVDFNPDFLSRNREFYHAQIESVDLGAPDTISRINQWASDQTHGRIPTIVNGPFSPLTSVVLINAIYFKGNWAEKFYKSATKELPFSLLNGKQKQHPRMSQTGRYDYFEADNFQAVGLPYKNNEVTMFVFLPREQSNLHRFTQTLHRKNWERWMRSFDQLDGHIEIPKFKLNFGINLTTALFPLGMKTAFREKADFGGISNFPSHIDDVFQRSFVEVNEEGTEAAAVTLAGFLTRGDLEGLKNFPFAMTVDRPFFFAIQDTKTGLILFMGAIVDPVL